MKVIIKCNDSRNHQGLIENFFLNNILPVLDLEIAIESTNNGIRVYKNDHSGKWFFDPTVEIIVELTEEARAKALDNNVSEEVLKEKSGKFFDEAMAIRKIEELNPPFSREYYSCNYRRGTGRW